MKWFRHDTDAHLDEKLIVLRKRHGWEGIGVYWLVVGSCFDCDGEIPEYKLAIIFEANEVKNGDEIFGAMLDLRLFIKTPTGYRSDRVTREIAVEAEYRKLRSEAGRKGRQATQVRRKEAKDQAPLERSPSTAKAGLKQNQAPDRTRPDQTVPNQDGSAAKKLSDDEVGEEFFAIAVKLQWCDDHYAAKTWEQGRALRGDDRAEFMRKVRLVVATAAGRPQFAKKIFHEVAGLVNDRGAMQSRLSPQEKQSREIFREETGQSIDES